MTMHRARLSARRSGFKLATVACLLLAASADTARAQNAANAPPPVSIEKNGTVQVPAHSVPMSSFLSPEGQAYVTEHLLNMQRPEKLVPKDGIPPLLAGYLPVAALGRIRVISLDYRQQPKYRFPAASEDVASAYRELLKTYKAENIGIYGCSAGGMLTGQAVAW